MDHYEDYYDWWLENVVNVVHPNTNVKMTPIQEEPTVLPSYTAKVTTPDGTMFVNISERNNKPYRVDALIGKAGSAVNSWSQALSLCISLALQNGISVHEIIECLSNNVTDRVTYSNGRIVRSGPDGLVNGLSIYLAQHESEIIKTSKRRGPTFGGEEY